ncbi:MAG: methyl-accepting chemotaxis protein [Pseudomonadota bacterium]
MIRRLWLAIAALAACLLAYALRGAFADFYSTLLPGGTPTPIRDALTYSPVIRLASVTAAAGILFVLFSLVAMALVDSFFLREGKSQISRLLIERRNERSVTKRDFLVGLEDAGPIYRQAESYAGSLRDVSVQRGGNLLKYASSGLSADHFFGPGALVDSRLFRVSFSILPAILLLAGIALATISLLHGTAQGVGRITETVGSDGLSVGALNGMAAFLICLTAAGFCWATARFVFAILGRESQSLAADIDAIFYSAGTQGLRSDVSAFAEAALERLDGVENRARTASEKLVQVVGGIASDAGASLSKSVEATLDAPLKALGDAAKDLSARSTEQSAELIENALSEFLSSLDKRYGAELSAVGKAIEETKGISVNAQEKTSQSVDDISRTFESTLKKFTKESTAELKRLHGQMDNLVKDLSSALTHIAGQQQEILGLMAEGQSASTQIHAGATEIGEAAKVSRETVERFITLAERMREISRSAVPREDRGELDELPLISEGPASQRLSNALRDLKRAASNDGLPEL